MCHIPGWGPGILNMKGWGCLAIKQASCKSALLTTSADWKLGKMQINELSAETSPPTSARGRCCTHTHTHTHLDNTAPSWLPGELQPLPGSLAVFKPQVEGKEAV